MTLLLIAIFFLVFLLSLVEEHIQNYVLYVYLALGLILICYAGFRPLGFDRDSLNYEYSFLYYDKANMLKEVSFLFITWFTQLFTYNVRPLFIIYAIIGISLKLKALRTLMPEVWFVPLMVYIGHYYILHDLTQIRAGVATGFFLLSLKPLSEGRRKAASLYMLCAFLFHYSSVILFPLLLASNKPLSKRWLVSLSLSIPVVYTLYFLNIGIFSLPFANGKLEGYQKAAAIGLLDDVNILNTHILLRICIFYFLLYMHKTLEYFSPYTPIFLKCMAISIVLFVIFSPISVMAFRLMELYGSVDIFLISSLFFCCKPQYVGKVLVAIVCLCIMSIDIFYLELLHE